MIYTAKTKLAMQIAEEAHRGQFDKSGVPYIYHPMYVAERMKDEVSTIVALLHDILEDTAYSIDLLIHHFGLEIVEAIQVLTKPAKMDYRKYIKRLKSNPIAKAVKLIDLEHNMDLTRLDVVTERDYKRVEMYRNAYQLLVS